MLRSHGVQHSVVDSLSSITIGEIGLCIGKIETGFIDPDAKLVVLCLEYIFKMSTQTVQMPTTLKEAIISNIAEIKPGDIVVHRENGIGQFVGIAQRKFGYAHRLYSNQYEQCSLYTPVDKLKISIVTINGIHPKLDKLGSPSGRNDLKSSAQRRCHGEEVKQMASRANQGLCLYWCPTTVK